MNWPTGLLKSRQTVVLVSRVGLVCHVGLNNINRAAANARHYKPDKNADNAAVVAVFTFEKSFDHDIS